MAKISEPEARVAYLAMGPSRSLAKLAATWPTAIRASLTTAKAWSSKFGWSKLARAYDQRVATKVVEKVEAAQVKETVSAVLALEQFATGALLTAATRFGEASVGELVDKAIDALKQYQVMTGGVSDRTMALNVAGQMPGETPEQARARRRAEVEAKYGPLGPEDWDGTNGDDPTSGKPH
jgi:hypothetical protein